MKYILQASIDILFFVNLFGFDTYFAIFQFNINGAFAIMEDYHVTALSFTKRAKNTIH